MYGHSLVIEWLLHSLLETRGPYDRQWKILITDKKRWYNNIVISLTFPLLHVAVVFHHYCWQYYRLCNQTRSHCHALVTLGECPSQNQSEIWSTTDQDQRDHLQYFEFIIIIIMSNLQSSSVCGCYLLCSCKPSILLRWSLWLRVGLNQTSTPSLNYQWTCTIAMCVNDDEN